MSLTERYSDVFEEELGAIQGISAKIHFKPDSYPKFCRARSVAFTLCKRVKEELEHLVKTGVLEPAVSQVDWATPIVPVVKPNGSIRICGDFRVTLNKSIRIDSYPLPHIEDLLGSLAGGKTFSNWI